MLDNNLAKTIVLEGDWAFSTGDENWSTIHVPGCWEAQGRAKTLEGPVRYRRTVTIPAEWAGDHIQIRFEAVSYSCTVFCNGSLVGKHRGTWTPFTVDLTDAARPGEENQIEVEVTKPGQEFPVRGSLAGFLPDVATTFGGLWQTVQLQGMQIGLEDVQVQAEFAAEAIYVHCRANPLGQSLHKASWEIEIRQAQQVIARRALPLEADHLLDTRITLQNVTPWTPDQPALYYVNIRLIEDGAALAEIEQPVGFRRLSAQGKQLLLNGRPWQVRGILSWGWEPERIAPYYTAEQARAEIRRVKAMGFNTIKLCLFVPNPTYFDIADEEGVLLWVEYPLWLPLVTDDLRSLAPVEYQDLTRRLRHHPSVAIYSLGCEMNRDVDGEFLRRLNDAVREQTQDVLVCDNSGSGESYGGLDFDLADFTDYHPYYDIQYFEPLLDHWRRDWQPPRPWIFGEFCDADTFRDIAELIQANENQPPWWMTRDNPVASWREEAQALVEEGQRLAWARIGFTPDKIRQVSYAQAFAIRKYTLETLRRRSGMGGYIITGLRDTPISTSGVWDDLCRPKWTATAFNQINGEDILSLDVDRRRTWRHGGDRPDRLDVYNHQSGSTAHWHVILHAAERPLTSVSRFSWELVDEQAGVLAKGSLETQAEVQPGIPAEVGQITCALPFAQRVVALRLKVCLEENPRELAGAREIANEWPVWVYPTAPEPPEWLAIYDPQHLLDEMGDWLKPVRRVEAADFQSAEADFHSAEVAFQSTKADRKSVKPGRQSTAVLLTPMWDAVVQGYVAQGGRVLLLQQGDGPLPTRRCPFWRESINLFYVHPLWTGFPHPGYTGLQFFGLAADLAFDSARIPATLPGNIAPRPILRRLDARAFYVTDYVFEAVIGKGKLLACTLRLQGGSGSQPTGLRRNIAGAALLQAMLVALAPEQPAG